MAFVGDAKALRIYDPVRQLRFKGKNASPSGGYTFIFFNESRPDDILGEFYACNVLYGSAFVQNGAELQQKNKCDAHWDVKGGTGIGLPIRGYSMSESKQIIEEALLCLSMDYGVIPGDEKIYRVFFSFGEDTMTLSKRDWVFWIICFFAILLSVSLVRELL